MGLMFSQELKSVIECLLFVSKDPLPLRTIADITELPESDVKILVEELANDYRENRHGLSIQFVANGYQMCTRPEASPYIEKLFKPQTTGLSKAALETVAIVAYKQPITRAEIEALRGVKIDSSLGTLVEKNLVTEVGRKEGPGRPMLFATTQSFLKYFGLKDISELPDPDQFAFQHGFTEEEENSPENESEVDENGF